MPDKADSPLLDRVREPADLRNLSIDQLKQLAAELRAETIDAVSVTGGHLGASLGVVELTVAIHAVFDTPQDRLIWDVGHQAYPHKILTGRRDRIRSLRKGGGLSGFTRRSESPYDPFGAAHSSTSISAGLGMAVARDFKGDDRQVIAVIGDGALSAGMAYEAINNAGVARSRLIVVLNDNEMSIAPPVGAMSAYLSRLTASPTSPAGSTVFDELGFTYVGPIDGHELGELVATLRTLRDADRPGPVLLHVVTQKGKGYAPAEQSADRYHGVAKFDVGTGAQAKAPPGPPSYTKVFANALIAEAEADERIVAVTAAMPSGTGLDNFGKRFPARTFDVGIAEQHAVTFAAGMATEGMKPFCAIYSTFLQRAYDQIVHDVALQSLPVRFAIDRAGLVGADGATHAGAFDIAYLGCLPNMVLMAAADELELMHMVATATAIDDRPSAFRFPRGDGVGLALPARGTPLEIGRGRIVQAGTGIAILSYGARLQECLKAAADLATRGLSCTVADARFAKPLDTALIERLAREHEILITIEEGAAGGFGSMVMQHLAWRGLLDTGLKIRPMTLPDRPIDHETQPKQYEDAGLDAARIVATAVTALGRSEAAPQRRSVSSLVRTS